MGRIILKSTDEHSIELTQYFAPDDESIDVIEEAKRMDILLKYGELLLTILLQRKKEPELKLIQLNLVMVSLTN